jgi:hypothetical protein
MVVLSRTRIPTAKIRLASKESGEFRNSRAMDQQRKVQDSFVKVKGNGWPVYNYVEITCFFYGSLQSF